MGEGGKSRHKETGEESCPNLEGKNIPQRVLQENGVGVGTAVTVTTWGSRKEIWALKRAAS